MVIDIADHAGLALAELADCEACGVRPETGERVWAIDACEQHSALLHRESEPGRLVADGGFETAETDWSRRVTEREQIRSLARDIDTGTHNMWVDIRNRSTAIGSDKYEPVTIDVTVTVTGGKPDREPPFTDGGQVTIDNPELFDDAVSRLKGIADDLDDLTVTASAIRDAARDLEAAARREVNDVE